MTAKTVSVPQRTPPEWLNWWVKLMLHTPGLQRLVGKSVALITFADRKSGRSYTIPVSYLRLDDSVIVTTKRVRSWWRNFQESHDVDLRLAGWRHRGRAQIVADDQTKFSTLATFCEARRFDAKAYGIGFTKDGRINEDELRTLLPEIVAIQIAILPPTNVQD